MPRGRKTYTLEQAREAFWQKVEKTHHNGCWMWNGSIGSDGYGRLCFQNRQQKAHRTAYYLTHGKWPQMVCHHCDQPLCVNPTHLYSGDPQTNATDAMVRGRMNIPRGSKRGHSKLTEEQVDRIRRDYAAGKATQAALADTHGVSQATIWRVVSGKLWTHVGV